MGDIQDVERKTNICLNPTQIGTLISTGVFKGPEKEKLHDLRSLQEIAGTALHLRRLRRTYFPSAALREACWDILLMCLIGQLDQRPLCIKQLRNQLDESHTALLRRVDELESANLLHRRRDEVDARRTTLHLTPETMTAMEHFFDDCRAAFMKRQPAG